MKIALRSCLKQIGGAHHRQFHLDSAHVIKNVDSASHSR